MTFIKTPAPAATTMTLIETIIYKKVCEVYRLSPGPVRTVVVADMLGKHDRYIREYLARLERKNYIRRKGQRGGWFPDFASATTFLN